MSITPFNVGSLGGEALGVLGAKGRCSLNETWAPAEDCLSGAAHLQIWSQPTHGPALQTPWAPPRDPPCGAEHPGASPPVP